MDLAARNVLLTSDKEAKISDFGLSRRLETYKMDYKKKDENVGLPWKWMAPESFAELKFTEKSDVWAFGVTLWEIYTFGGASYPGQTCNTAFLQRLENGIVLEQPTYCQGLVYPIMQKCWKFNPADRPTFSGLQHNFLN